MELTGLSLRGLRTKATKEHILIYHNKTSFTVILCLLTRSVLTVCRVTLIIIMSSIVANSYMSSIVANSYMSSIVANSHMSSIVANSYMASIVVK